MHIVAGIILSGIFLIFSMIFTVIVDFRIGLWTIQASLLFILLALAECRIEPDAARKAYKEMVDVNLLFLLMHALSLTIGVSFAWIFAIFGYIVFVLAFFVPIYVARKEEVTT